MAFRWESSPPVRPSSFPQPGTRVRGLTLQQPSWAMKSPRDGRPMDEASGQSRRVRLPCGSVEILGCIIARQTHSRLVSTGESERLPRLSRRYVGFSVPVGQTESLLLDTSIRARCVLTGWAASPGSLGGRRNDQMPTSVSPTSTPQTREREGGIRHNTFSVLWNSLSLAFQIAVRR